MARITGKNAAIYGVLARTTVSVAVAMTDGGAHTVYTLVITASTKKYWNPNLPPAITKQVHGTGSFNPVSAALYTVDYINGTVTFLAANNADDVVKINGIEYMTLQAIGDMFNWTLDLKIGIVDATAFGDAYASKLASIRSWTGGASGYHVSAYWYDAFAGLLGSDGTTVVAPEFYVVFYTDIGAGVTSERFVGAATIDFALDVKKDAAVTEKLMINGTGALLLLTS